jgi:hypothetical protein
VQIDPGRADRQERALNIMGDLPGRRPIRITGKGPIQIAGIERRDARTRHGRRQIGGRHDDDAPADVRAFEVMNEAGQCDLSLILVAVIAGHEQYGRSLAIPDHRHRDVDHPVT